MINNTCKVKIQFSIKIDLLQGKIYIQQKKQLHTYFRIKWFCLPLLRY